MDDLTPLSDGEKISFANMLNALKGRVRLSCGYKNWRGEYRLRRFEVIEFWHGSTERHPDPSLMLRALDLDRNEKRDFRVLDFNTETLKII